MTVSISRLSQNCAVWLELRIQWFPSVRLLWHLPPCHQTSTSVGESCIGSCVVLGLLGDKDPS